MNSEIIENSINQFLVNVKPVGDKIVRGERRFGESSFAAVFVDYSQAFLQPEFDIVKYQDTTIAKSFYETGMPLQWDHYLILVAPSEKIGNPAQKQLLKAIESDTNYARKLIVNETGLQTLLSDPLKKNASKNDASEEISDPYIRWVLALSQADLDGIYLGDKYTEIVRNYLAGKPIKENSETAIAQKSLVATAHRPLDLFKIETSIRGRPAPDEYPLGTVNLLYGPNGAGKTSFLEGIELALCGASARNPKTKETQSKLAVRFQGQDELEYYDPTNTAKYRHRDQQWYGNRYDRDNRIHESFAKYNFFDTDNAVHLATDEKRPAELRNAFVALTLGEQINYLDERMEKVFQLFLREFNESEKSRKDLESRLETLSESIKALTTTDSSLDNLFNQFQDAVKRVQWKIALPSEQKANYPEFDVQLSRVIAATESLLQQITWLTPETPTQLTTEGAQIVICIDQLSHIEKQVQDINQKLKSYDEKISGAKAKIEFLEKAKPYVEAENVVNIRGLKIRLADAERGLARLHSASEIASAFHMDKIRDITVSIDTYSESLKADLVELQAKHEDSLRNRDRLKEHMSLSNRISSDIKTLGREFLENHKEANDCPMCGANYEHSELVRRVLSVLTPVARDEEFRLFSDSERVFRQNIEETRDRLLSIEKLKECLSFLNDSGSDIKLSVAEACIRLKKIPEDMAKQQALITQLREERISFELIGVSEDEFHTIEQKLKGIGYSLDEDRQRFNTLFSATKADFETATVDHAEQTKQLNDLQLKIHAIGHSIGHANADAISLKRLLEQRHIILKKLHDEVDFVNQTIIFADGVTYISLRSDLKSLEIVFNRFKVAKRESAQKSQLVIERQKEEADLKKLHQEAFNVSTLAKRAMDAISNLKSADGKEKNLKAFLEKYRHAIMDIFSRIHSPPEFDEISIEEDSAILIRRVSNGQKVPLTMVSTGQRAALALALFLTLHTSAQNAPRLILIDDPVAHVDDLNTLAFFDYLRDLVVYGKRQIIFATADSKIAKLFEKKFSFLKTTGEFKLYPLSP